eukprot:TRINITY_DN3357_c0_g1_i2.p1 TRINITY_DN3357_c0_g1~~TRINITY_DN3357_c0_g1_i2.p1  ORF type:complete len:225 (-),score=33.52 TRINITY_DN3357_c0_g1_i2:19-693(-)
MKSLERKAIILAVPSVGHSSQLAADLLISSFGLERVNVIESDNVAPFAAVDFKGDVSVAVEVFSKEGLDWALVYQRGDTVANRNNKWANELVCLLAESHVSSILLLSSMDVGLKTVLQTKESFFVAAGEPSNGCSDTFANTHVIKPYNSTEYLHESGFAFCCLKVCHDKAVPSSAFIGLSGPGMDFLTAAPLVKAVCIHLGQPTKELTQPQSWLPPPTQDALYM